MKLLESSNEYIINDTEYFYNLNRPIYHPSSILAYVPKLMAKFAMGSPKKSKDSVSSGLFCNNSKCKPKPSQVITTQNYITITNPPNLSPSFYSTSSGGRMNLQVKHIAQIYNKDIRQIHFIEDR